ncbi:MAG TPA: Maf family protein [Solirubrobacterales bacterium]
MSPPRLVLASASPRRREILTALGIPFEVLVPRVEEVSDGPPAEAVIENARRKARAGASLAPDALALGADTEVVLDGRTLGKPGDEAAARERLEALSGRTHEVLSGLALVEPGGGERTGLERSLVTFRTLDPETLELYLASGEWRDRAGGYAIQGLGSILIARLEGDFSNVVGLPVGALLGMAPELSPNPKAKN